MFNSRKNLLVYLALGLLLGGTIDVFIQYRIENAFVLSSLVLFCFFYGLAYNDKNSLRLLITSLTVTMLVCSPLIPLNGLLKNAMSLNFDKLNINKEQMLTFLCAFPLLIFMAQAFHYTYHRDNTWRVHYSTLFSAVWDTLILMIAASLFCSLTTALITLAALMFKTVGSTFLSSIYYDHVTVRILIHTTSFFLGLYIAIQNQKAIHNLRFLLLRMMQFLFPLLAAISIIYFFLYLAMTAQLIKGEPFSQDGIIGALVLLGIVFFNANFQTGEERSKSSFWKRLFFASYQIVLLCLCLKFIYFILSTTNLHINVSLYLLIALSFCLSYAIGSLMSAEKQPLFIKQANIGIALFFLLAILSLNNPFLPATMTFGHEEANIKTNIEKTKTTEAIIQPPIEPIDKELIKSHLYWQTTINQQNFIAGHRGKTPLYICGTVYNNGNQIGSFSNNQCTITYGGQAFTVKKYQILASKKTMAVTWSPYPTKNPLIKIGAETTPEGVLRSLYACRVTINGQLFIGKMVDTRCNIAIENTELALPIQSILTRSNAP